MELIDKLNPDSFILFIAPPAWGKTSLILELYQKCDKSVVFLSPLRALAEEVFQRIKREKGAMMAKDLASKYTQELLQKKNGEQKKFFMVATVETFPFDLIDSLSPQQTVFIIDEFHLFYLWGETFRPLLKQMQYAIGAAGFPTLALSASFEKTLAKHWYLEYYQNYSNLYLVNYGNLNFKTLPQRKVAYVLFGKKLLEYQLTKDILSLNKHERIMLFCNYRNEVDKWYEFCTRHKIKALACVGGEVPRFLEAMSALADSQVIIATSVLSHGVNLPSFQKVYLNTCVENESFWLQMASRAGRKGENFEVHSLNTYHMDGRQKLRNLLYNFKLLANYFLIRNFGVW